MNDADGIAPFQRAVTHINELYDQRPVTLAAVPPLSL